LKGKYCKIHFKTIQGMLLQEENTNKGCLTCSTINEMEMGRAYSQARLQSLGACSNNVGLKKARQTNSEMDG
jgi:hypothetical protein